MKIFLVIIFCVAIHSTLFSQDTSVVKGNIRQSKPFFPLLDVNGFGLGYSIHKNIDIQATTMVFTSGANIKVYLSDNNSAPFIGLGIGNIIQGLAGTGESNDWSVAFVGWQYHPFATRGLFIAAIYQYALHNGNKKADYPTMLSFNFGVRLF